MREFLRRIHMLLRRRRWRRDLEEEMLLHRQLRGDERRFGNDLLLRERSAAQWGWTWLETWLQDARHGLRLLARTPLITALALVSLALGIGATTALFSLTNAALLQSLPVSHPGQLAEIFTQSPHAGRPSSSFTNPMWEQVRDHQDVFSGAFAWSYTKFRLASGTRVGGIWASGEYFSTLGIAPVAGRLISRADDYPGCPLVADISQGFWHSRFGAAPSAIGQTLQLSGHPYTIIGVVPASFPGLDVGWRLDVAVPLCAQAIEGRRSLLNVRDGWWLMVMGRLKQGESLAAASAHLGAEAPAWMAATVPQDYNARGAANYRARRMSLAPGGQGVLRLARRYGQGLTILLAIAGLVLLVACANLAGLMLARASARRPELAMRQALGAGRGRLIRQLLTETLLLAIGGATLGVAFAISACAAAQNFLQSSLNLSPDARVLAFTIAVTLLTALLAGLAPALRATGTASVSRASARPARWPAIAQIAIALLLLTGAGLFLRTFLNLTTVDPGFDLHGITWVDLAPPEQPMASAALRLAQARVLTALQGLPGVASASQSFMVPLEGLQWDNSLRSRSGSIPDAYFNAISPGYFATLRSTLVAGRDFSAPDSATAPAVIILNQSAARALFPNGNALGGMVTQPDQPNPPQVRPARVVGIVADAKYVSLSDSAPPTAYYPQAQLADPFPNANYELRSALPEAALTAAVNAAMKRAAPALNFRIGTMDAMLAATLKPQRMLAWLAALFGGLALLLTAIGLYGVMAYSAQRRRREFGIRLALGARPRSIIHLELDELARIVAIGCGLGLLLAWLGGRALAASLNGLLYGLRATDAATMLAAAVLLAAVTAAAAYLPARRAARSDPMATLREE